jgi:KipI family sensor histidine kinase inhibitor
VRILPSGSAALLLELDDLDDVRAWHAALKDAALPNVVDLVPAARTLLVVTDDRRPPDVGTDRSRARAVPSAGAAPRSTLDDLADRLREVEPAQARRPDGDAGVLDVPVLYDGDDLAQVALLLGCDEAEVVRRHTRERWTVAFCGFAPGFGYLVPDGDGWHVPRRDVPRTRVPAGSVGLAGAFTGVYPTASPGGWQLIGRTTSALFDPEREPAALLTPGRRVRFRALARESPHPQRRPSPTRAPRDDGVLTVVDAGHVTTQDEGRPGYAGIGVSPSGAADRASYRLANRLVGNAAGAAALEVTAGGLVLRAERDVLVAVTGAPCAGAPVDASLWLRSGSVLRLGVPARGLRTYVAVRGGFAATPVLGSRSTDVLSRLGPSPVTAGEVLASADAAADLPAADVAPRAPVGVDVGETLTVRVLPGPRRDWLADGAWQVLTAAGYRVTSDSSRVGVRLDGSPLQRAVDDELPSEGLVRGAVQLPPSGLPLVFLADHPTTGGYPVIAYVLDEDVDAVAQLRPGDALRFTAATAGGFGTPEARV